MILTKRLIIIKFKIILLVLIKLLMNKHRLNKEKNQLIQLRFRFITILMTKIYKYYKKKTFFKKTNHFNYKITIEALF